MLVKYETESESSNTTRLPKANTPLAAPYLVGWCLSKARGRELQFEWPMDPTNLSANLAHSQPMAYVELTGRAIRLDVLDQCRLKPEDGLVGIKFVRKAEASCELATRPTINSIT